MNNDSITFGLISDIQYADIDDGQNFSQSELRQYRSSAQHAKTVLDEWGQSASPPAFIGQLGDLIDGQNAGQYGQGLELTSPQSEPALSEVLGAWSHCAIPTYHSVGNHELYNFSWEQLSERLNRDVSGVPHQISDQVTGRFYYSTTVRPTWRLIMLNCYEVNVIKPISPLLGQRAEELLRTHNPNYGRSTSHDFFDGLPRDRLRFVPFNGGLGREQLDWLDRQLSEAKGNRERVLIMGHLPLCAEASSPRNLAFDAPEILDTLGRYSSIIVAYFAGHRHGGGYARDQSGIHHLTVQAPLTHGYCAATVTASKDRMHISGMGAHRSYEVDLNHLMV